VFQRRQWIGKESSTAHERLAPGACRMVQDAREGAVSECGEQVALGRRQRRWLRAKLKTGRYRETGATLTRPNDAHGDKLILASRVAGCTIRTAWRDRW